jgi:glycosyltransferase involved in cell wall biosynthesis
VGHKLPAERQRDTKRCGGRDIRHLVVLQSDMHPDEANGVVGVARKLVREQRAAGEHAQLIRIAHRSVAADASDLIPGLPLPTKTVRLSGNSIGARVIRLHRDVVATLLSDLGETTFFHIHGAREPLLADFAWTLRRRHLPYAVTLHGRFSHIYNNETRCEKPGTALYLRLFERGMLHGAQFVQALSGEEAQILGRIAPRSRIEILGNGAYSLRLDSVPVRPAERSPSTLFPHFVYCGRYAIQHKGLDLLLKGFAHYRQRGGKGRLTTIGTGPQRETLTKIAASLGVADVVDIGGPLFGNARDAALRRCDFFIMASRFEGIPLAPLEAALIGIPLIVTTATGLGTQVKKRSAGVVIEELTAEAVCVAMLRVAQLSAAEWAAWGSAAYDLAVAIGDWTAIADRLRALYEYPSSGSAVYEPLSGGAPV